MRFGIITDIHGNQPALETVLSAMDKLRIDKYICLGDVVGYGASPKWCLDTVRDLCEVVILGNHDAAVIGKMDSSYYYDAAKQVIEWTRQQLTEEDLKWLNERPYIAFEKERDQCFTHGDPIDPERFNYIYLLDHAMDLLQYYEELHNITWVGHSHLRRIFRFESPDTVREVAVENLILDENNKYLVACGSVGQPRDGDPRTGFVVFDSDDNKITFHRLEYDVQRAHDMILEAGLPHGFAFRLMNGV